MSANRPRNEANHLRGATGNQQAYLFLIRAIERVGLTKRGFLDRLTDLGYAYNDDDLANWGRAGRSFPRDWGLLLAIVRALTEGQSERRRCTASEALEFLGLVGMPFTELRRLAAIFPAEEFRAALSSYLPFGAPKIGSPELPASGRHGVATVPAPAVTLPVDRLPAPAALPIGSHVPFGRNPLFVGREDDLVALAHAVGHAEDGQDGHMPTVAITGLGGTGKTQLATEFVHRYGQFFPGGVYWLSFADAHMVATEVAGCGGIGRMELRTDFGNLSLDAQVRLVRAAWQSPVPRLLVFDNCEDEALLAKWRPVTGGCTVLLTTRRAEWSAALGVRSLALKVLSRSESVALLHRYNKPAGQDSAYLEAIAAELGDLPLALHLAGNYLARYRHSVTAAAYLAQLRSSDETRDIPSLRHPSLQGGGVSPTGHIEHIARTFALSYDQLDRSDPTDAYALNLLVRAACFAPGEPIPQPLLFAAADIRANESGKLINTHDALQRLVTLGLVNREASGALRLHRLVVAFARERARDASAEIDVQQALVEMAERLNEADDVASMLQLQQHLRFLTDAALLHRSEQATALAAALGYLLWRVADYAAADTYLRHVLMIHHDDPRRDELTYASALQMLGLVLQAQTRFAEARPLVEQALAIWERRLGSQHLTTSDELNNLGYLLLLQGDYPAAKSYLARALVIRRQVASLEHPETARSLNNLGYLFLKQGELRAAWRYLKLALKIRQKVLPEQHLSTSLTLSNLSGQPR